MILATANTTFALDARFLALHPDEMRSAAQILAALRQRLDQREITQSDVARVIGITQPNVATFWVPATKTGKTRKLSYDEGVALIQAFDLNAEEAAEQPRSTYPNAEMLEPILDALLPLVPQGRVTDQSRRALAEAIIYLANTVGLRYKIRQGVRFHVCPFPPRIPQ